MKQVGVYDAKTQLPKLLDEVEQGESIEITRHGKPVARLVPIVPPRRNAKEAVEALRAFRDAHPLEGLTTKDLVNEGRKR